MQVTGCEHWRWVGPERRPEGRLDEEAGDCSHCGRPMLWMTEWDAQVLGVPRACHGRWARPVWNQRSGDPEEQR